MSTRRARLKDHRAEAALFRRRAVAGFALIVASLAVLAGRFAVLQVARHAEFATRADANRIRLQPLPPARGLIYDRNGVLLAENRAAYRLEVVPERVRDLQALLHELGGVVALSDEDLRRFDEARRAKRKFQSVPLRFRLSEDELARFAVNSWRFPGVEVVPYQTRSYPLGAEFGHVVGYVGRIDEGDLRAMEKRTDTDVASRYAGTTHIGKTGVERQYEDLLHGEPGFEQVETNADGRALRVLERSPPTPGRNLYLTIDAHLQEAAEAAFAGRPGAAVAIDPRNGEVLALVSVPNYDPNLFVNGIAQSDYSALLEAPDTPLLDRALRGRYPPGSTMKPFVGLAGLELGFRTPQDTVISTGEFFIPGQSRGYRDDIRWGHGRVDLELAIEWSVNTYFYQLALDMGIDRLAGYLGQFGFGAPTGIDLPGEGSGVLPSREWKRASMNQPWYLGETVIAGIGQGYWVVTPLQLAHAVATLGNRGVRERPHLLLATQDGLGAERVAVAPPPSPGTVIRKAADWAAVEAGMHGAIYGDHGTARGLGDGFPYTIAGKTGTVEKFSRTTDAWDTRVSDAELAARHRALFICFTPAEAPRIAVAVVLESAAWGGKDAAPLARKILDAWLRSQPDAPATASTGAGP